MKKEIKLDEAQVKIILTALVDYDIKTEDLKNVTHRETLNGLLSLFSNSQKELQEIK